MQRSEIDAIPLEGDLSFRQRAVEPDRTALLLIDLQKGEYNPDKSASGRWWSRTVRSCWQPVARPVSR